MDSFEDDDRILLARTSSIETRMETPGRWVTQYKGRWGEDEASVRPCVAMSRVSIVICLLVELFLPQTFEASV